MRTFGRRVDGPGGRRQAARQKVNLAGTAMSLDGSNSVALENISSSGAKLLGRCLPKTGKEILIRTDDFCFFGCVAWANDHSYGIAFADDLHAEAPRWGRFMHIGRTNGSQKRI